MVCLGNICRSPMAEGILRHKLEENNMGDSVTVDSCGFVPAHLGEHPHPLAILTAKSQGVDIGELRQRLFLEEDFDIFDKIYVMDMGNYRDVQRVSRSNEDMLKVDFLRNVVHPKSDQHVPDPWGGTLKDFQRTFRLIDEACEYIVKKIRYETL